MKNPQKVKEILDYAVLNGWSEADLFDAQWALRDMPIVSEGIERRTKFMRIAVVALIIALLSFGITLLRFLGVW